VVAHIAPARYHCPDGWCTTSWTRHNPATFEADFMKTASGFAFLLTALLLVPAPGVEAQEGEDVRSAADSVYTEEQAARGKRIYDVECALCHGPREFAGAPFVGRWGNLPLGSLFVHIQNTMPQMTPGILSAAQTADLVSYVLSLNGFPAGEVELPAETAKLSRIRFRPPADPGGR
jgi:mono/diheme cytochrome c family protein